ncbi:MAG TPA: response regulator transcription factor [Anaerolineales bacterium]|nr:response regulator transcription factor [Anaerolineales bacterium]HLO29218.1 response regulator transcription factor [Anaerolineales bacterium]
MNLFNSPETSLKDETGRRTLMVENRIKVLIVDDHSGVRKGIKNLLQTAKDMVVVGEGVNGAEAIELVSTRNPDILLLDIELPDQRGDRVMRHIHDTRPDMKVLAVSSYSDRDYILGMLENGASGYITKDEAPMMLLEAIRSIINKGMSWFSPRALKNSGIPSIEEQTLTKREVEILEQLVLDRSIEEIAASLSMSEEQVERYLKLLLRKFETESLVSLKHIASRILSRRGT